MQNHFREMEKETKIEIIALKALDMGLAPSGYINKITEDGKKNITFDQPEASILKWCFEEIG